MGRQVRLKKKGVDGAVKVVYPRSVPEILKEVGKLKVETLKEEVIKTLTEEEVKSLVDTGAEMDAEQKDLAKIVKAVKVVLMAHAKENKWKEKNGDRALCTIKKRTISIMAVATQLAKFLKKEGKSKLFDSLVKVEVTPCKKYLGEVALEEGGLLKTESEEYGSASLKLVK